MYRVLICLCVTVALCLTACSEDDYEQVLAPLDTLTVPVDEVVLGDADDVTGITTGQGETAARDLEAATE